MAGVVSRPVWFGVSPASVVCPLPGFAPGVLIPSPFSPAVVLHRTMRGALAKVGGARFWVAHRPHPPMVAVGLARIAPLVRLQSLHRGHVLLKLGRIEGRMLAVAVNVACLNAIVDVVAVPD